MVRVNKKQIDAVDFSQIVERLYSEGKYETLLLCVDALSQDYDIPEDKIKKCLTPNLIRKLRIEAEENGYLKKSSTATFEF